MFGARKPCWIGDLLPLKFRTQMVSPIQNTLTKYLETICKVILAKTSQKMIVNLLMMILIDLPIVKFTCPHHVSGYVRRVWHLFLVFFSIDWNNFYCKTLDHCTLFLVLKHEKQTLSYIHTKFEGHRNNRFFSLQFIVWEHLLFCPNTENYLGLMSLKLLGMNRVKDVLKAVLNWKWTHPPKQTQQATTHS